MKEISIIEQRIFIFRGQRVMIDSDLAMLYGVETKALIRQVKRNKKRFPTDFTFVLDREELKNLRCQFGTSSLGYGGRRTLPYVFTQEGIAMLSSVLNSERAIKVNIAIMRVFVRLREMMGSNKELAAKLAELEAKLENQGKDIRTLFNAIRQLMAPPPMPPRKPIGFNR